MTTAKPVIIWEFSCEGCGTKVWSFQEDFENGTATLECFECGEISTVVMPDDLGPLMSLMEQ
jgi:uncharacterized Zn finger protein